MKLKFITSKETKCIIGINGQIRFSKSISEKLGISKFTKYEIAYDEDEKPIKSIYLYNSEAVSGAFSVTMQNGGYFIPAKKVVEELKLNVPINCKIIILEKSTDFPYGGMRLSFF